eukprot:754582-Hanusia_phi.AAC.17
MGVGKAPKKAYGCKFHPNPAGLSFHRQTSAQRQPCGAFHCNALAHPPPHQRLLVQIRGAHSLSVRDQQGQQVPGSERQGLDHRLRIGLAQRGAEPLQQGKRPIPAERAVVDVSNLHHRRVRRHHADNSWRKDRGGDDVGDWAGDGGDADLFAHAPAAVHSRRRNCHAYDREREGLEEPLQALRHFSQGLIFKTTKNAANVHTEDCLAEKSKLDVIVAKTKRLCEIADVLKCRVFPLECSIHPSQAEVEALLIESETKAKSQNHRLRRRSSAFQIQRKLSSLIAVMTDLIPPKHAWKKNRQVVDELLRRNRVLAAIFGMLGTLAAMIENELRSCDNHLHPHLSSSRPSGCHSPPGAVVISEAVGEGRILQLLCRTLSLTARVKSRRPGRQVRSASRALMFSESLSASLRSAHRQDRRYDLK